MEHGDDPVLTASLQFLKESRDRDPKRRIGRFKDVFGPQLFESQVFDPDRLGDFRIIRGVTHRAVDRAVMHDHHHAVESVFHIAFDSRVAVLGGHLDSRRTVLVDVKLIPIHQPASSMGDRYGKIHIRSATAGKSQ